MAYVDPAEKSYWCPKRHYLQPLLSCLRCPHFPCMAIDALKRRLLAESPFVTIDETASFFTQRREKMYILKYNDGRLVAADDDFDPDNLSWKLMQDVEEVLYVSKVFVPQIRLVAKPLEERARIRKALSQEEPEAPAEAEAAPEAARPSAEAPLEGPVETASPAESGLPSVPEAPKPGRRRRSA